MVGKQLLGCGEASMTRELYACVHAAEFPAQSLVRLRPDLKSEAIAILEGQPPLESICSINKLAYYKDAVHRMTRVEAEAIAGLRLHPRSLDNEASARAVLLECLAHFSPRIEDASVGTITMAVLDIAGMEKLLGAPDLIAMRIRSALKTSGFHVSIAVSANFHAACLKASFTRGVTVISPGGETNALSLLPIKALDLPKDHAETFASWGIRSLGELAALKESDLVTRLGPVAQSWRELALGVRAHVFRPVVQAFPLAESCEFEMPVEQIESLLFVSARMIDCLVDRAKGRALALAALSAQMKLENGQEHQCSIRPALPSIDRKFLLKLLQLQIAAHPPPSAVMALTLSAEAGQTSKVQLGLFALPTPEPTKLDVTLARLKALVGANRVGSPVIDDTNRASSFQMKAFAPDERAAASSAPYPRVALRRMRPPLPVRVEVHDMRPVVFRDRTMCFAIDTAFGPWRTSGCWWTVAGWGAEEWDVLATSATGESMACLLACDRTRTAWRLEAIYD
jgi:protein ImuB